MAIEVKVWSPGQKDPLAKGLIQLDSYLAGLGLPTGWLVIFDRRPDLEPASDRTTCERVTSPGGREIFLIRA